VVLDRQCAVEAGNEFPNFVVGEEGHVNNCRICDLAKEPPSQFRPPSRQGLYHSTSSACPEHCCASCSWSWSSLLYYSCTVRAPLASRSL